MSCLSADDSILDNIDQSHVSKKRRLSPPKHDKKTSRERKKAGKKAGESTEQLTSWPAHFLSLRKVFEALNSAYTFIGPYKHIPFTMEAMKSTVEKNLKRPLEIRDIAQIACLLPDLVKFAYVNKNSLHMDSEPYSLRDNHDQGEEDYILVFELLDGNIKPGKNNSANIRTAMTKLILKRNKQFDEAVDKLLTSSSRQKVSPEQVVWEAANNHIPVHPAKFRENLRRTADRKSPNKRLPMKYLIDEIKLENFYVDQIVKGGQNTLPSRQALYDDHGLSDATMKILNETKGIKQLYTHQAKAIKHLSQGKNVVISTSTASGKSLIYQLIALEELILDFDATFCFIYPTKALAQDQKRHFLEFLSTTHLKKDVYVETFDGDTPLERRDFIRDYANIVITNPDTLHRTILPCEENWRRFFRNLKLVVIDEVHTYNGLFGCHVAWVMRRLRRVWEAHACKMVRFLGCSATLGNSIEHMKNLTGIDEVCNVEEDGSPSGSKEFVVWNPPLIDPKNPKQGRMGIVTETSRITKFLVNRNLKTIVFAKSRRICEVLVRSIRDDLAEKGQEELVSKVMCYRSGYSPEDRRRIEQDMFKGSLIAIVATTALEVGIDLGCLDAVVMVGFPFTNAGLWQQTGRAGRRNNDSLAILVCDPYPFDQYYAKHPDEIFTALPTKATFSLENPHILEGHLHCAAHEFPINIDEDEKYFGHMLRDICAKKLCEKSPEIYSTDKDVKSRNFGLRSIEDESWTVVDVTNNRNRILEELETTRAIFEVYEGAVFLHQGVPYMVTRIRHDRLEAQVQQTNVTWITIPRDHTDIDVVKILDLHELENSNLKVYYGSLKCTTSVYGYHKIDKHKRLLDSVEIVQDPFIRSTSGIWIDVPLDVIDKLNYLDIELYAAIHGASHALLGLTPLYIMTSVHEIKTVCREPVTNVARILLYDEIGKETNATEKLLSNFKSLITQALDVVNSCPCEKGCPSCIDQSSCSEANQILSKQGAQILLEYIIKGDVDKKEI